MESTTHALSPGQHALWFLQRLEPQNPAYNIARAIRIRGPVDPEAMQRAWNRVAKRHKILRTRIQLDDEQPVQIVDDAAQVSFEWTDAESFDAENSPENPEADSDSPSPSPAPTEPPR